MAEDTIPRPIRYKFLERAQTVCDLAKVDYWEYSEVVSGLREQMEASYRAHEQANRSMDDPEARTLEDFGSVEAVARVHRDGWRGLWQRLYFNQRYSVHRLVAPVIYCLFHSSLRTQGSQQILIHGGTMHWSFVGYGWDYYIGVIVLISTVTTKAITRRFRLPELPGKAVAIGITFLLFMVIGQEWYESVYKILHEWGGVGFDKDIPLWGNWSFGGFILFCFLLEAVAFSVVLTLALAEILDWSAMRRYTFEERRKAYG